MRYYAAFLMRYDCLHGEGDPRRGKCRPPRPEAARARLCGRDQCRFGIAVQCGGAHAHDTPAAASGRHSNRARGPLRGAAAARPFHRPPPTASQGVPAFDYAARHAEPAPAAAPAASASGISQNTSSGAPPPRPWGASRPRSAAVGPEGTMPGGGLAAERGPGLSTKGGVLQKGVCRRRAADRARGRALPACKRRRRQQAQGARDQGAPEGFSGNLPGGKGGHCGGGADGLAGLGRQQLAAHRRQRIQTHARSRARTPSLPTDAPEPPSHSQPTPQSPPPHSQPPPQSPALTPNRRPGAPPLTPNRRPRDPGAPPPHRFV
jgi:hypothetical protein